MLLESFAFDMLCCVDFDGVDLDELEDERAASAGDKGACADLAEVDCSAFTGVEGWD